MRSNGLWKLTVSNTNRWFIHVIVFWVDEDQAECCRSCCTAVFFFYLLQQLCWKHERKKLIKIYCSSRCGHFVWTCPASQTHIPEVSEDLVQIFCSYKMCSLTLATVSWSLFQWAAVSSEAEEQSSFWNDVMQQLFLFVVTTSSLGSEWQNDVWPNVFASCVSFIIGWEHEWLQKPDRSRCGSRLCSPAHIHTFTDHEFTSLMSAENRWTILSCLIKNYTQLSSRDTIRHKSFSDLDAHRSGLLSTWCVDGFCDLCLLLAESDRSGELVWAGELILWWMC